MLSLRTPKLHTHSFTPTLGDIFRRLAFRMQATVIATALLSFAGCDNNDADDSDDSQTATGTSTDGHVDTTTTTTTTTTDDGAQCAGECDPFNPVCGAQEQCSPYRCDAQALAWDMDRCVPIGPRTLGETCEGPEDGRADQQCADGLMCWGGICKEKCTGSREDPQCPSSADTCLLDGVIAVCMTRCDPFASICAPEETCVPAGPGGLARDFGCIGNGFITDPGERGSVCEYVIGCADGFYCTFFYGPGTVDAPGCEGKNCCTPFCRVDEGDEQCPGAAERCIPVLDSPAPGAENYGWCVIPRD
jgi:hypothetical protein